MRLDSPIFRRFRAKPWSVFLCLILVVSLCVSGCTQIREWTSGWEILDEESVILSDDIVLAWYLGPQSRDYRPQQNDMTDPGYVVLVNEDGELSALRTLGMDVAEMVWDERGLFFSDLERDYLLSEEGLTTWDSPKTQYQIGVWTTPDGGYIGLYNRGFGLEGDEFDYVVEVVETNPGGVVRYEAPGMTPGGVMCDDGLYTISEVDRPWVDQAAEWGATRQEDTGRIPADALVRLWSQPTDWSDAFRSIRFDGSLGYPRHMACRNGVVLAFAGDGNTFDAPLRIVSWPTDGSPPSETLVTGPEGEDPGINPEDTYDLVQVSDWSPDPGHVVWYAGDGLIRSTTIADGRTSVVWDSDVEWGSPSYVEKLIFVGDMAYTVTDMVEGQTNGETMSMLLRSHNLSTGETQEIISFDINEGWAGPLAVLRGIATRPGL